MKELVKDFALLMALAVVVIAIAVGFCAGIEDVSCKARWKDSGIVSRWSFAGGCQLKTDAGNWIPADSYRAVE